MTLTQTKESTTRVLRFDRVQRAAHWANATLFGLLMFTAIPLYFGSFFGVVMQRHVMAQIHLWSGLALPIPIIVSLIGPWGRQMRRDVRRFNYWTRREIEWMRTLGKSTIEADKFNPGQKLNAIFIVAAIIIMLATGSVLQWFRLFPVPWRVGATFVHDVFAYAIFAAVIGHVVMALTHTESLRSMFSGWVSETWAAKHAPGWLKEEKLAPDARSSR
ncbi:MAG TPA: cytochrome b/b6 domain-containing protein [Acidimicrobiales bacterium]|jgi:formate dehydrogenase subunit gamma|nr:cytochrome b/b6 domain-containing protein [Acidimicrobiales bacterium]